ncbi:MAG: hypothetical protein HEQ39_09695 [Rhizobacter sp.]
MSNQSKATGDKSVKLVALQPIQHDGEKFAEGATLVVPQQQAQWLLEVGAAEVAVDSKTKAAELAAEAKAKAEADAAAKAEAEAKAKADADALAKANGTQS